MYGYDQSVMKFLRRPETQRSMARTLLLEWLAEHPEMLVTDVVSFSSQIGSHFNKLSNLASWLTTRGIYDKEKILRFAQNSSDEGFRFVTERIAEKLDGAKVKPAQELLFRWSNREHELTLSIQDAFKDIIEMENHAVRRKELEKIIEEREARYPDTLTLVQTTMLGRNESELQERLSAAFEGASYVKAFLSASAHGDNAYAVFISIPVRWSTEVKNFLDDLFTDEIINLYHRVEKE